jgi:poly-gamma-glutamate synthesis protein (capsule biosynthesis protein)
LFLKKISIVILLLSAVSLAANRYDTLENQPQKDKLRLLFTGDVTLSNHFENHVGERFDYPFKKIPWFSDYDITMINLENPLTTAQIPVEKKFTFKAPPVYVAMLKNAGVDIVTLANNHIYDYGKGGLLETLEVLKNAGIQYIGAGKNMDEARKAVVFTLKGVRVAFLGYYGLKKHSDSYPATQNEPGTALRKLKYIREDLKKAQEKSDFIIVNFHWGLEKENYPQEDQERFAHKVIDAGADLIIGHHPHVLQGIENYNGKIIAYSLGNFIFGGNSRKHEKSIVLEVEIDINNPMVYSVKPIPIQINYWQPSMLNTFQSTAIIDSLKKYSSVFEKSIFK